MRFYKIIGEFYEVYDIDKNITNINLINENGSLLCIFDNWDEFEDYLDIKKYKTEGKYVITDYVF